MKRIPKASEEFLCLRNTHKHLEALLRALKFFCEIDDDDELCRIIMSKYPLSILDCIATTGVPTLSDIRERVKQIVRNKEDIANVMEAFAALTASEQVKEKMVAFLAKQKIKIQKAIE